MNCYKDEYEQERARAAAHLLTGDTSLRLITCPWCGLMFVENCEYVDIGIGSIQSSPNVCLCGASELGHFDPEGEWEKVHGWREGKPELRNAESQLQQ